MKRKPGGQIIGIQNGRYDRMDNRPTIPLCPGSMIVLAENTSKLLILTMTSQEGGTMASILN